MAPETSPRAGSVPRRAPPRLAALAAPALQFLPTPLLVLSADKRVVLANRAMGRLVDVAQWPDRGGRNATIADVLRGLSLDELGIEMLQQGRLAWVSWDLFLDTVMKDAACRSANIDDDTADLPDSSVDVVVMSLHKLPTDLPSGGEVRAKMIVSLWEHDGERYLNLSFTSVPRSRSLTVSSDSSASPEELHSATASPVSAPEPKQPTVELPSIGAGLWNNPSIPLVLRKVARMKDVLLDAMDMPVYVMWHDGSIAIPNRAGWELAQPVTETSAEDPAKVDEPQAFHHVNLLSNFVMYTEDFSRRFEKEEYPIITVLRTKKALTPPVRLGMYDKHRNRRIYDCGGRPICDKNGDFVAGMIWMRDVTDFTEQLHTQKTTDDLRFRTICDCMPQMIWTTTPDGAHDYFSKRWHDYTGIKEEDMVDRGKKWLKCFHPDDVTLISAKWDESLATGRDYAVEYRCQRHDGVYRWMLGRALALRDPKTNTILKWYGTTTDIHDLVEARSVARATREQLLEVLMHGNITLWACNRDRKITLMEGGTISDVEDHPEAYIGKDVESVFKDWPQFCAPLGPLLKGETSEAYTEMEVDGRWFKTKYVQVRGKKGGGGHFDPSCVTGVIGLSLDTTEMRRAEKELEEQFRQNQVLSANESAAKEASKLKSEFLASMSHEIRTPIAGVVGMAEILLDTNLRGEQREFAENISRSANALLTVINDILDISKVESGRMDIEEVQFNLSLVIRDVVKMLSFDAERKKLRFESEVQFRGDQDLTVMGDPGRIRQILMNLLSNSMKFTNEGFVQLEANIAREDDDRTVVHFVVRDSGIGIDEEVQQKLFQPFTQADSSTARRFGGTGLGLTISKNLVDLMGGEIGLSSGIGEGTTAFFSIPFRKPQYPNGSDVLDIDSIPDRLQSDASLSCRSSEAGVCTPPESPLDPEPRRRRSQSQSQRLLRRVGRRAKAGLELDLTDVPIEERKKRHVLVVEDNEINKQIAIRLVKKLNFNVSAVSNGLEALDFLAKSVSLPSSDDETTKDSPTNRRPDIILMDVQMPEMDGYSATRAIRSGSLLPPSRNSPSPSPSPDPTAKKTTTSAPKSPRRLMASQKARDWLLQVPIVAMTASAIQGDKEKCRDAGMDDYLAKPVRGTTLEKMLVKWCTVAVRSRPQSDHETDSPVTGTAPTAADAVAAAAAARGRNIRRSISEPNTAALPTIGDTNTARRHSHTTVPRRQPSTSSETSQRGGNRGGARGRIDESEEPEDLLPPAAADRVHDWVTSTTSATSNASPGLPVRPGLAAHHSRSDDSSNLSLHSHSHSHDLDHHSPVPPITPESSDDPDRQLPGPPQHPQPHPHTPPPPSLSSQPPPASVQRGNVPVTSDEHVVGLGGGASRHAALRSSNMRPRHNVTRNSSSSDNTVRVSPAGGSSWEDTGGGGGGGGGGVVEPAMGTGVVGMGVGAGAVIGIVAVDGRLEQVKEESTSVGVGIGGLRAMPPPPLPLQRRLEQTAVLLGRRHTDTDVDVSVGAAEAPRS